MSSYSHRGNGDISDTLEGGSHKDDYFTAGKA